MAGIAVTSDLRRVSHLRRKAMLVQKDSRLYVRDLNTDQPARVIRDFSNEVTYGYPLATTSTGECLLSNGAALLACDIHGRCREVVRLEQVHLSDQPDPACERHISGPFHFCNEAQRVYFCLAPGRPGELPPEGRSWTFLCELDLRTQTVSSTKVGFVGDGCAIDGVSRVVYLPGEGRTRRDMAKGRDRVLKKSLAGGSDETVVVPDCVNRCELTDDREQLLCSHDSLNGLVHLVDCRRRSFLGIKRRRCKLLPVTGFNATFGPRGTIFFVSDRFSLWRYEVGSRSPERLIEVKLTIGSPEETPVRRSQLRQGVEAVWEAAKPPLIHSSMELLCWQVCLGMSVYAVVVVDLLHGEYAIVDGDWRQMAIVEA